MKRPSRGNGLPRSSFSGPLVSLLAVAGFLGAWEALARFGAYPRQLFPPPTRIFPALWDLTASGELWTDVRSSGVRWTCGFLLGAGAGMLLGAATGLNARARQSLGPILNLLRTLPFIVLIPLALLWFGLGEGEKIAVVAWGAVFPVWLNTQAGMKLVAREHVWAARCLGASGWRLFWSVHARSCLPYVAVGLRVSIATATFALAAAEMAGAFDGLAYRVFYAHQMFQTEKMMAGIVFIAALGWALDRVCVIGARRLMPWHEVAEND